MNNIYPLIIVYNVYPADIYPIKQRMPTTNIEQIATFLDGWDNLI